MGKQSLVSTEKIQGQVTLYSFCPDAIVYPMGDRFVVSNVFARTHVEVNPLGLALLGFCLKPRSAQQIQEFFLSGNAGTEFRDRTCFSNIHGLLADPSNLIRESADGGSPDACGTAEEILELLSKRLILISDFEAYRQIYQKKRNIFDDKHLGNFHQQLGYELRIRRKLDPDRWWLKQKFSDERDKLRDNLYKFIQLHFWESTFDEATVKGKRVLDVGCGPGFYSRFLARRGASVVAVDPTREFIDMALESNSQEDLKIDYRLEDIGRGTALERFTDEEFDLIIFQDAFLFYFIPYDERKPADRKKVLSELRRILKRGGTLTVIEPHGVFWLAPWLGSPEKPFTLLTEYSSKQRGVTPTLTQIGQAFYEAGFLIRRMGEIVPSLEARRVDPRAYGFASQFPLWWFFELTR